MKWEKLRLSQVAEYITDGDHQPAPKAKSGISFIKIKDIENNSISFDSAIYVPDDYYNRLPSNRKPQQGDVLYTVVGSYGIPVYVQTDKKFCFERNIALIHPNNRVYPLFLYYSLLNPLVKKIVDSIANGSAQKLIPLSKLERIELNIPSLLIQNKITNVLSSFDRLISINQKQIKLLEEAAQRLYKEWFVDLRFPGHETTPINDGVPEGWSYVNLKEIADVVMGQSPKSEFYNNKNQGLPFHQGVGSYGDRFVIDNTYSTSYTRIAKENSILFSVRAPVGRMNITKNQVVIGRGLASIIHKKGLQSFLFYQLKDMFYKDNLVGNGSIFASISKNELLQLKLLVPSFELVKKYNDIISVIDKRIENIDNQKNLAQEARDRLLPKLMNGEIEV